MTDIFSPSKNTGTGDNGAAGITTPAVGRRSLLAAITASPVLLALGTATGTPAHAAGLSEPGLTETVGTATAKIVRGGVRRFNAPRLTPGARLRLPEGVKAVSVEGYFENRPRVAPKAYAWPNIPAADGTMVDASIVPERNAASRMAILSGFKEGWYELIHPNGKIDRVEWNAQKLPYLWFWGEFGAFEDLPLMGRFYTLGLEPFSRPPVS
ncbi:hypothetical protein ACTWQF_30395 [Streptomyces sp. 8N114]|uniref:hypothetical protein n=1 Tax=Streptomyces sp. 8N114 TaxID=3457419 RepID=UPI003FD0E8F7